MNQIYSDPIQKAQLLISSLKKHSSYLQTQGYDLSVIERLEALCEEMTREGEALAAEEEAVAKHRNECHVVLTHLREELQNGKGGIKQLFPHSQWLQYGVPDKR